MRMNTFGRIGHRALRADSLGHNLVTTSFTGEVVWSLHSNLRAKFVGPVVSASSQFTCCNTCVRVLKQILLNLCDRDTFPL